MQKIKNIRQILLLVIFKMLQDTVLVIKLILV